MNTKNAVLVFLLVVFLLFLRWNSITSPFERDEGEYSYSAWILQQGKSAYKDAFMQKPPAIIYTYWLGQILDKDALWPPRAIAFVFLLSTCIVVGKIAEIEFTKEAGILAAFLLAPMVSFPYFMGLSANTEIFMLLPLSGVLLLSLRDSKRSSGYNWFFAGMLSAVALMYKPICLFALIYIFAIWMYQSKAYKFLFFAILGALAAVTMLLLPIILTGSFNDFVEQVIIFNSGYVNSWGFGIGNLIHQLVTMFSKWWVMLLPLCLFFFGSDTKRMYYLGLILSSLIAIYQVPIGHYYLILMPSLAIAVSSGLVKVSKYTPGVNIYLLVSVLVVFILLPIRSQFGKTPQEINLWIYGTANPFTEAELVAQKIAQMTNKNERVFIAGSEPEILFYSKRISPTKFVITYPLNINTPRREEYQQLAVSDLKKNPPKVIVLSQRQFSGLWNEGSPKIFLDYLVQSLERDYQLKGGYVWTGENKGYWATTLDNEEVLNASLLVYLRK